VPSTTLSPQIIIKTKGPADGKIYMSQIHRERAQMITLEGALSKGSCPKTQQGKKRERQGKQLESNTYWCKKRHCRKMERC
jgi:hypothetical protein